jgi:hypothetical protein
VRGSELAAARAAALRDLQAATFELTHAVARGEQEVTEALSRLLALAASARRELFKFEPGEVWNLMLYKKENDLLVPWVRHCDRRIERQERRWKLDEGHVGLAVSARTTLVAGDLPVADGFVSSRPADAHNYRSAVSVPLLGAPPNAALASKKKVAGVTNISAAADTIGAFVVTSSRLDHFLEPNQPEVLTAEQVCLMLRMVATATPSAAQAADDRPAPKD